MKPGIHLHLVGLSLADTDSVLDSLSVERCRITVRNCRQRLSYSPQTARTRITSRMTKP